MFVFHFWIECACRVIEHDGEYNQESTMWLRNHSPKLNK
jgi:hypothetical protein